MSKATKYTRKTYPIGWVRAGRVLTEAELEKIWEYHRRLLDRSMELVK